MAARHQQNAPFVLTILTLKPKAKNAKTKECKRESQPPTKKSNSRDALLIMKFIYFGGKWKIKRAHTNDLVSCSVGWRKEKLRAPYTTTGAMPSRPLLFAIVLAVVGCKINMLPFSTTYAAFQDQAGTSCQDSHTKWRTVKVGVVRIDDTYRN